MEPRPIQRTGPLDTLTHARLRAAQGDVAGARRILDEILSRTPGHREARALRDDVVQRRPRPAIDEPLSSPPEPQAADASALAETFRRALAAEPEPGETDPRIERLRDWLRRVSDGKSEPADEPTGGEVVSRR